MATRPLPDPGDPQSVAHGAAPLALVEAREKLQAFLAVDHPESDDFITRKGAALRQAAAALRAAGPRASAECAVREARSARTGAEGGLGGLLFHGV